MYVHCKKCDHEWECTGMSNTNCEWCGGESYILSGEPPLEIVNHIDDLISRLREFNNPYAESIIGKIERHK